MMYIVERQSSPQDSLPAAVGMIGLGVMGRPMARNLLSKRGTAEVLIHARSADRVADLVADGATWAATPRELAAAARVVLLMLPDLPEVEVMLYGPDGILAGVDEPKTLVISSTSSASEIRGLGNRLTEATGGLVALVDAPVSGGEDGAVAGTLSIMVGGDEAAVATALPVLATMGNPVHLGGLGSGEIAKFCNQMIVASTIMALGEAAVLAERSGLDLVALFGILEGGYAGSRVLQTRKERIVTGNYSPSGAARYMVKDLTFAQAEAAKSGTDAQQLRLLLSAFTDLTERGFGDKDISVTRAYVEARSADSKPKP